LGANTSANPRRIAASPASGTISQANSAPNPGKAAAV